VACKIDVNGLMDEPKNCCGFLDADAKKQQTFVKENKITNI